MKQHYVPQFLLRPWVANSPDRRVQVFRLDLDHLRTSRRATRAIAYEENLYSLTRERIGMMDQHAVENIYFRDVDQEASQVHKELLASGFQHLSPADHNCWARFLMSLRIRQPDVVSKLRREASATLKLQLAGQPEQYLELAGGDDPPTLTDWTEAQFPGLIENIGVSFLPGFVDNEKVGNAILHMGWHLRTFPDADRTLLIGDHPCIWTGGIDDPEVVIALPISPRAAFFAIRSEVSLRRLRARTSNELVTGLNESTIWQARSRVFATDCSQQRFVENRWIARHRHAKSRK